MAAWHKGPLVGLDFETTGVDPTRDLPVQAAVVWCTSGGAADRSVFLIDPGREVPAEAVAIHGITTERARREGCSLEEAAVRLHRELSRAAADDVPVVAMNASFDVTIAARLFRLAGLPQLPWRLVVDPLVIDRHLERKRAGKRCLEDLCRHYAVTLDRPHDAGADALAAVELARQIGRRWWRAGRLRPERLTTREVRWHAGWAARYDATCRATGRPGLSPGEYSWPVREPTASYPARESRTMSTSSSLVRGLTMAMRTAAAPRWVVGTTKAVPSERSRVDHV